MSTVAALAALAGGLVLVVAGAELFFEGVLASAQRLRVSPFVLTAVLSGFEVENLAAGIAANAKGLPGAAAGTFLGGSTFLALGVAGVAGLLAPIRAELPRGVLIWTALAPLPLVALALDGTLADVILFGSFLLWAVFSYQAALRRDIAAMVGYVIGPMSRDMTAVAIGVIAWAAFTFWLHEWLIGVRPLF